MNSTPSGANLPVLRSHNTAVVLGLLRSSTAGGGAGISRPEIAERTGLTPQAVSKIVARLRAEGLAAEAGQRPSTGGKPRRLLRLVRTARYAVGLHLDRDECTAVLADLTGEPVAARTAPLDLGAGPETVLDAVSDQVRQLSEQAGGAGPDAVLGIGAALPGPLDHGTGVLGRVTRLPRWHGFPLRAALAERLGLPVRLDKDTNAAALALLGSAPPAAPPEAQPPTSPSAAQASPPPAAGRPVAGQAATGQEGKPAASFAYLHLGTGLGAGLVLGGEVYRGPRTGAGEFGHQVVQVDGPRCGCGRRGCLEAVCLAALESGDRVAAARLLGVGAANLAALLDIDRVVLGGRAVLADAALFTERVAAELASGPAGPLPVSAVAGGRRLVAEGAALLALAPLFDAGWGVRR